VCVRVWCMRARVDCLTTSCFTAASVVQIAYVWAPLGKL
jgi:hypothetical protein